MNVRTSQFECIISSVYVQCMGVASENKILVKMSTAGYWSMLNGSVTLDHVRRAILGHSTIIDHVKSPKPEET